MNQEAGDHKFDSGIPVVDQATQGYLTQSLQLQERIRDISAEESGLSEASVEVVFTVTPDSDGHGEAENVMEARVGRTRTPTKQSSSRSLKQSSSRSLKREESGHSLQKQGSSRSLKREGSGRGLAKQSSSRSLKREGSDRILVKQSSSKSLKGEGIDRDLTKQRSPRSLIREGSARSLTKPRSSSLEREDNGRSLREPNSLEKFTKEISSRRPRSALGDVEAQMDHRTTTTSSSYKDFPHDDTDFSGFTGSSSDRGRISQKVLEITDSADEEEDYGYVISQPLYTPTNPWFPAFLLSIFFTSPTLLILITLFYDIMGRMWAVCVFSGHLFLTAVGGISSLTLYSGSASEAIWHTGPGFALTVITSISSLTDIVLFSAVYPMVFKGLDENLFTECDGSSVPEYVHQQWSLRWTTGLGYFVVTVRLILGSILWGSRGMSKYYPTNRRYLARAQLFILDMQIIEKIRKVAQIVCICLLVVSMFYFAWSLFSVTEYFYDMTRSFKSPGPYCDPLDTTECMLPFPSYHFMVPSITSFTGYRVNLIPEVFPPLKGRGNVMFEADFLNRLDGFPTMGPLMFYIDGLKEAHQAVEENPKLGEVQRTKLMWPSDISQSTTPRSMTLLIDVESKQLVPHSAEIDYLDITHPLVLVFPDRPLKHGTHYALAVVNATDVMTGERFPPTDGMKALMKGNLTDDRPDDRNSRRERFQNLVIPALESAAPWFSYAQDPEALQLLFDFPTVSEASQLGPIRGVRDATMDAITGKEWKWEEHARVKSTIDHDCLKEGTYYARTLNAELDVPWFLQSFGAGQRGVFLDDSAVDQGKSVLLGKAKFRIHVPCSVWAATVRYDGPVKPREISAVLEHGHGLFYNRNEANAIYLQRIADEEGYIVTSMDWRGMSSYDLLVVVKALVAKPETFQAIRDNLIQGYACKLAMQHFSRHGLWSTDWLSFNVNGSLVQPKVNNPSYAFYGNSQGGILGAGYVALSGTTGLIDRGILGVPGTPFALIMTRSLAFEGYDKLLLLNFHHNRHVRMFLGLAQMGWDSTEGSGFLAQPVNEPYPPVLMQAGLGDSTVPTNAAEALARGFGARLLPHHPRDIFGLSSDIPLDTPTIDRDPYHGEAIFTELLFKKEFETLPKNDIFGTPNDVHNCLRKDEAVIRQLVSFINNGEVLDVCEKDYCERPHVDQKCWWG